jgi:hypothetical protein
VAVDPRDIVNPEFPLRHDPDKLADALVDIAQTARAAVARPSQSWWTPVRGRTNPKLAPATVTGAAPANPITSTVHGRRDA